MSDLSILIPARNEMFLAKTVEDILNNMRGDTEVFVLLDGYNDASIVDHPKLTIVRYSEAIGQRAGTNVLAKLSKSKYLMKVDAHCAFDEGFDVKMMNEMHDDWTMVPVMRNLHAFDWVCQKCGHREYQGITPTTCPDCDNTTDFKREIMWIAKTNPLSTSYCFDSEPHFQYFREFKSRPEGKGDITETMSLQGSCFMLTRDKYFELNVCDEDFGSWGSQGIEVAVKTWLSGGRVVVNHKTWYAHMFRTKGGDFGFPYPISGRQTAYAKNYARELFFNNKWPKQIRPLSWLLEKFWPVPGWTELQLVEMKRNSQNFTPVSASSSPEPVASEPASKISKGILYYTDNRCNAAILKAVRSQIQNSCNGYKLVSVSLEPISFGKNIVLELERGALTMFKQILAGLEELDTDVVFFAEHDVLYNKEHFMFTPPRNDIYYYNKSVWQVRLDTELAVYWDCKRTSQLCAYRDLLIKHYKERIRRVEAEGFTRKMGYEPGSHNRPERVDDYKAEWWETKIPNLDIRHERNLTSARWSPAEFRSQRNCRNWKESSIRKLNGWEGLSI